MKSTTKQIKIISAVILLTILLSWFYYAHETFPQPIRAVTAIFATPVAITSGLSYYLNLGIPVYNTPWAIILSNLIFSTILVIIVVKLFNKK